jgi:hypothetical protein
LGPGQVIQSYMQTNLFTKEQINQESSVGEFYKGKTNYDSLSKLYFSYPGVEELFFKAQKALQENKKVIFKTKTSIKNSDISNNNFLKDGYQQNRSLSEGLMTSHFGSLLTPSITGQKILGNYSIAFIEAQASKIYHEHFHKSTAVDHFYSAQGVANVDVLTEVIKAFDFKRNEVVALLTPANSIRAFKNDKYSNWNSLKTQTDIENASTIHLIDKVSHQSKASIKLISNDITNLESPIYKVKTDDRWTIIVPWQISLNSLDKEVRLEITNNLLDKLKASKNNAPDDAHEEIYLEASIGQATRVVFELLDGDYDNVPEAMLNFEGGSWSSITLENCSTGRHQGTNSMHEVLHNKWYEHQDIAIPWNYLGFDRLSSENKDLLDDPSVFVLSFEDNDKNIDTKNCFLEANQSWKKIINEISKYTVKFVYREYSAIASKKYLLSTKEIMLISAKFLANWSINNYDNKSPEYKKRLQEENIPTELTELLECVAYAHLILSAQADFHSGKTHSSNIAKLKCIAKIQKILETLCPISVKNFKQKVFNLLQKDIKTEHATLWDLYKRELAF